MSLRNTKFGLGLLLICTAAFSPSAEARNLGQLDFHAFSHPVPHCAMTADCPPGCAEMKAVRL